MRSWIKILFSVVSCFFFLLLMCLGFFYTQDYLLEHRRSMTLLDQQKNLWDSLRFSAIFELQHALLSLISSKKEVLSQYSIQHLHYFVDQANSSLLGFSFFPSLIKNKEVTVQIVTLGKGKKGHRTIFAGKLSQDMPVFSEQDENKALLVPLTGLDTSMEGHLVWFATYPLVHKHQASTSYIVAFYPIDSTLAVFHQYIGWSTVLVNEYGQAIQKHGHFDPGFLEKIRTHNHYAAMETILHDENMFLVLRYPIRGIDHRRLAILMTVHNVTDFFWYHYRLFFFSSVIFILLFLVTGVFLLVLLYRHLTWVSTVIPPLTQLSEGSVPVSVDEDHFIFKDELGIFSRIIWGLRYERLKYDMLVDERDRLSNKRSRMFRHQLGVLAKTLDDESRDQIMEELHQQSQSIALTSSSSAKDIIGIALVFERLVGMVTAQQNKLKALLADLQKALEYEKTLRALQRELEIARKIQESILPPHHFTHGQVILEASMLPAREVGGDFYDYMLVDEHHLLFAVADVSGKGIPAAFFMAMTKTLIRGLLISVQDTLPKLIETLNDILCADNPYTMFVTMFVGIIDTRTGVLDFVNAGHPDPVFIRSSGKQVEFLQKHRNMAAAVMEKISYTQSRVQLADGDIIFVYTDGFSEAMCEDGHILGEGSFKEIFEEQPLHSAREALEKAQKNIHRFVQGAAQSDDMTSVVLQYLAPQNVH